MAHLILATSFLAADALRRAGTANVAIGFRSRFVFGPLPPEAELATLLEARSAKHDVLGTHWLDDVHRRWLEDFGNNDMGFFEFCEKFDSIELWVDPQPNDQLVLIWLLDFLRPYREIISKLSLVQTDDTLAGYPPEGSQSGSCRCSRSRMVTWQWQAGPGMPIVPRRPKAVSICCCRI